ncbi:MAG TPA: amidohydrolase family protein [Gemmatimonadaceae bacterium]|nr:amidohydrolase family protein [Gemmatimonadaceae bacterium]
MIDVHCYIGGYPFRHLPHPDPEVLARVLARERVRGAWVGHLPSAFYRDPTPGNEALHAALEPHRAVLAPAPVVRPDWPKWEPALADAVERGAAAVRAYPPQWGMGPGDGAMARLAGACGEAGVPLLLTVRFEDLRQRHWMDSAGDLGGPAVRALVRASPAVRVVVVAAGRALVEEVHWGLTPDERERLWWDISWLWGPPEDELAHLLRTVGPERFLYGSGWPLRLTQTPRANLELLPPELEGVRLADASAIAAAPRATTGGARASRG